MVKIADRILFYLILKPVSFLPLGVLYFISSVIAFLTYHVVRYRRKVVRQNLKAAFPEKSDKEIKAIEVGFYKHFCDFIMESIKAISISEKQLAKRTSIKNPELIEKFYAANKNLIVTCGHYNNWEFYALSLPKLLKYKTYSVYQPLKNTFYDTILYNSRIRNGMTLIKTRDLLPFFSEQKNEKRMVIIVNDQSPSNIQTAHWNTFLNQPTGWNIGPEKLAKKYDYAVLFGYSKRVRRGYYEVEFSTISENPTAMPDGTITNAYSKILEDLIISNPRFWLWSHKRWKHPQPLKQEKPLPVSQQIAS
ncbi:MAG: lysophospholipid acyltransferase family protein [Bacteroidetes bacterium]|nr:lysophospholipid acyltransferase family protein [Bacteroidota bacterium]